MGVSPSFFLPACGMCSHVGSPVRPMWRVAHRTTERRKTLCYFFIGCPHSEEVADSKTIRSDPKEWAEIEAKWAARAKELFTQRTKGWSATATDRFRMALEAKSTLPGATIPLDLDLGSEPKRIGDTI